MTAVQIRDLRKQYVSGFLRKKVDALKGVSFEVEEGECVGLVGPNGAGKTTTLKILTGLVRPTEGSATIFGEQVGSRAARRQLGYLPENPYFYEHLTPVETLELYGALAGLDRATVRKQIPDLIERVGLGFAKDRQLKKFSKGMRQRIGIAQALINDPRLVILDEPQSGLDPEGRREMRDLIVELHESGKTVIICSHILPDVQAVCDRVVALKSGKVRSVATLSKLRHVVRGVEVSLTGSGDLAALAEYDLTAKDDLFTAVVPDHDAADALARRALDNGFRLYSMTPHVPDLEEILLDAEASS